MKVETMVSLDLRHAGETAKRAEALGYDGVLTPETGHDPFFPLVIAGEHTSNITLGTAVAICFPRSPMVTAQMAWDLQKFTQRALPARAGDAGEEPQHPPLRDAVARRARPAFARVHPDGAGDLGLAGRTARRQRSRASTTSTR